MTYPLDLIRTRFSILGKDQIYKGLLESFSTIYKLEGIIGLYRGLSTSLVTVMPSMGLLFYTHSCLLESFDHLQISQLKFSAGFLSGMLTKSLLYPFDTIRKRLQIQGPHRNRFLIENVPKYSSTIGVVSQMIEHEGILSLYKGILPSILKSGLSCGMSFLVFDYCRMLFRRE